MSLETRDSVPRALEPWSRSLTTPGGMGGREEGRKRGREGGKEEGGREGRWRKAMEYFLLELSAEADLISTRSMALEQPWSVAHSLAHGVQTLPVLFHLPKLHIVWFRYPYVAAEGGGNCRECNEN